MTTLVVINIPGGPMIVLKCCFSLKDNSSVEALSRVRLCDPMNCGTPGFPVHHQLLELSQTQVH